MSSGFRSSLINSFIRDRSGRLRVVSGLTILMLALFATALVRADVPQPIDPRPEPAAQTDEIDLPTRIAVAGMTPLRSSAEQQCREVVKCRGHWCFRKRVCDAE